MLLFAVPRAVSAAPAPAAPDPVAVALAAEANHEPVGTRAGLVATIALGSGVQTTLGVDDATGVGGAVSLRLAQAASPRWLLGVELDVMAYPAPKLEPIAPDLLNQSAVLAVSGQFYPRPGLWARVGFGVAGFTRRAGIEGTGSEQLPGLGAVGGGGVELLARRSLALQLEVLVLTALLREGLVIGGALGLGLVID